MGQQLLTQQALSDLIAVSERTLERWRVEGSGPVFCRAGRKVLYRLEDVSDWLAASRRKSTCEPLERLAMAKIDFAQLRADLNPHIESVVRQLLPDGRLEGREWISLNPTRTDRHAGSFRVNIQTGRWADFATDDKGGDIISLAAYLECTTQIEAARRLIKMTGVRHG